MPPPEPPRVKLGRRTHGRPTSSRICAGLVEAVRQAAPGALQADLLHALLEQVAVLGLADRLGGGADQLAAVPLQRPALVQGQADVQAGLAAERRQDGVGLLDGDDLLDDLGRDRLDVGPVGHLGVGHDRGRVRVDQDDLVPLLAQRLARLGARVVELARLADDDRPGADDQDLVDVGTLGHVRVSRQTERGRRGRGRGRARPPHRGGRRGPKNLYFLAYPNPVSARPHSPQLRFAAGGDRMDRDGVALNQGHPSQDSGGVDPADPNLTLMASRFRPIGVAFSITLASPRSEEQSSSC